MQMQDIAILQKCFEEQGWEKPLAVLEAYYEEQGQGKRKVFVAEYKGLVAGYVTLLSNAKHGAFQNKDIPEISDFNVFEKHQRHGIGKHLLDTAETEAKKTSPTICLGIGMHSGYGSAQRMYIKRGYIPDGTGVWYQNKIAEPYSLCVNDDDLVLYLSKQL